MLLSNLVMEVLFSEFVGVTLGIEVTVVLRLLDMVDDIVTLLVVLGRHDGSVELTIA